EAKKKDENLLKFPERLLDVQSAARISVENIESEFTSLYVRTKSLEEKVQDDQELFQQLEPFLQSAGQTLQDLKRRRLDLRKEGNALIDFFCEEKDTFKLDEGFRIFQDFCIKFKKAVKDNLDRELKEEARLRRLRELEEKRYAWPSADQNNGVFGRSSSENDVDMLTNEGLLDFFQQRSQSPHSPLARSASARRHRHTMNSVADRELQSYLEMFSGPGVPTDYSRFNSLPRSGRSHQRRTTPWLLSHPDSSRELGRDRPATALSPPSEQKGRLVRKAVSQGVRSETRASQPEEGVRRPPEPPRHSSLPPDESKAQRGSGLACSISRWARDNTPKRSSYQKPSAKPLRNIPKAPPEEKMCRSTMRALAQAQAQAEALAHGQAGASLEAGSSQVLGPKSTSGIPGFARNTVASTSRVKKELVPPSVPSTPSRSPSLQVQAGSALPSRMPSPVQNAAVSGQPSAQGEERTQGGTLRRVQSVRSSSRSSYRSGTPPPPVLREDARKTSCFSEKSTQSRERPEQVLPLTEQQSSPIST
ncbi:hypothetical protein CRUP_018935, partial [Coryphaenoides rupestris]